MIETYGFGLHRFLLSFLATTAVAAINAGVWHGYGFASGDYTLTTIGEYGGASVDAVLTSHRLINHGLIPFTLWVDSNR